MGSLAASLAHAGTILRRALSHTTPLPQSIDTPFMRTLPPRHPTRDNPTHPTHYSPPLTSHLPLTLFTSHSLSPRRPQQWVRGQRATQHHDPRPSPPASPQAVVKQLPSRRHVRHGRRGTGPVVDPCPRGSNHVASTNITGQHTFSGLSFPHTRIVAKTLIAIGRRA